MANLYETIRRWADGQNALNESDVARGARVQAAVDRAIPRLQRHASLGDLGSAYYAEGDWWALVAQEFELPPRDSQIGRDAAYWQRFMQIRHPSRNPRRVATAE